jgi:hypothetical protein
MAPVVVAECRVDMELRILLDEEYEQLCSDRVMLRETIGPCCPSIMDDGSIYLPVNIGE